MIFRIATRRSALAQAQADTVISMLKEKLNIDCEKVLIETLGDKRLDVTIDKIGGKGVFVKDIQNAMVEGNADGAVHSMKDVPFAMPDGFKIVAIPEREDVRDAFVSLTGVSFFDLPKGAKVGTSSLRRRSQIRILRPDIEVVPIRGNIQTRVDKINTEKLDGILLAAAGLKRLNMENFIVDYFNPEEFVPAVGQGALGFETLTNSNHKELFKKIDCEKSRICIESERSFMKSLNGDCHTPIGAYAELDGDFINMIGMFELDGKLIKKDIRGNVEEHIKLGEELAKKILNT
ncbi:porphobilinogen deaminase HemC [Gottschalkia acidurici 9a]|uniref:Porphobilinogen deaminase n=1 Tax=Gottschalkia acidurici (strain ATCC 7906 / DSM 604 / BCRC 14475 / CIP 104303 / KCTC 5404 / NCIMB 10678 / 9a) TaxID=1128398 RepID=K0B2U3_GOTA9|nr:hydroxymethylbilane synthase [Gottschalkia acidurici]AFS79462.1 porphobilinogen deaminase HemC [Gottschalkia acidurici 9a]